MFKKFMCVLALVTLPYAWTMEKDSGSITGEIIATDVSIVWFSPLTGSIFTLYENTDCVGGKLKVFDSKVQSVKLISNHADRVVTSNKTKNVFVLLHGYYLVILDGQSYKLIKKIEGIRDLNIHPITDKIFALQGYALTMYDQNGELLREDPVARNVYKVFINPISGILFVTSIKAGSKGEQSLTIYDQNGEPLTEKPVFDDVVSVQINPKDGNVFIWRAIEVKDSPNCSYALTILDSDGHELKRDYKFSTVLHKRYGRFHFHPTTDMIFYSDYRDSSLRVFNKDSYTFDEGRLIAQNVQHWETVVFHPKTGSIFVVDKNGNLIVFDKNGYKLHDDEEPFGKEVSSISFSPTTGDMFIRFWEKNADGRLVRYPWNDKMLKFLSQNDKTLEILPHYQDVDVECEE